MLLLVFGRQEGLVGFVLVFLPVYCFQVALLRVPLLQIELPLELHVIDANVHLDDVIPEEFFLVEGLLDFSDGEVGGSEDAIEADLEGLADELFIIIVGEF